VTDRQGFVMESDTLGSGIDRALEMFQGGIREAAELSVTRVVDSHVPSVVQFMKQKARWTDVTGDARRMLDAKSFHEPFVHTIVVFHQVPYGGFLEVIANGKYGIILLTIEAMGEDLMTKLTGMLSKMRFSFSESLGTGWAVLS
jgi:hypothetical protein